jgi:hypothetical protein
MSTFTLTQKLILILHHYSTPIVKVLTREKSFLLAQLAEEQQA